MSPPPDSRRQEISLVLGPSGSGKSLFALKRLPAFLTESHVCNHRQFLGVHFQASEAATVMAQRKLDFPDAVAFVVNSKVTNKLKEEKISHIKSINLTLHITIDEAGKDIDKKHFASVGVIQRIVDTVKWNLPYKFQWVHLTAVGTGLETTTDGIDSLVELTTYRMQPWTLEHFQALVRQSAHSNKLEVMVIVKKFPILLDLITNARCAFYLLRFMENMWFLGKNRQRSMVNVLITSVADSYIASNELQKLTTPAQKWAVAKSLFSELDKATMNKGVPFIPEFVNVNPDHKSIVNSLLDKHVESTSRGNLTFVSGNCYALSLSPAIALVMVNLLNTDADTSFDWEGFECNVMLSEMKRMVVNSNAAPKNLDRFLLPLKCPLPQSDGSNYSFSVPLVNRYTVVMNGPLAEYADVIAPYRLVQAKFSANDAMPTELELQDELDQMGVTESSSHSIQQMITSVFYTLWQQNGSEAPPPISSEATQAANKDRRYECYPFDLLNSRHIYQEAQSVYGEFNQARGVWDICGGGLDQTKILSEFDKSDPVTAVFATNAKGFRLKRKRDDQTGLAVIEPDDVDYEGKLITKSLPDCDLRENVQVRFLFF